MAQAGFDPTRIDYTNFSIDPALLEQRDFSGRNEVIRYLLEDGTTVLQTKDLGDRVPVGLVIGTRSVLKDGLNPDSGWAEKADIINRYLFSNGSKLAEAAQTPATRQIFKFNCAQLNDRLADSLIKHRIPKLKNAKVLAALGSALGLPETASADEIRAEAAAAIKKGGGGALCVVGAINAQYIEETDLSDGDKLKARAVLISSEIAYAQQKDILDEMAAKKPALKQKFEYVVDLDRVDLYFKGREQAAVRKPSVVRQDSDLPPSKLPPLPPVPARPKSSCAAFELMVGQITAPAIEESVVTERVSALTSQLATFVEVLNASWTKVLEPLEDVKGATEADVLDAQRIKEVQREACLRKFKDLHAFAVGVQANAKLTALNGLESVQGLLAYAAQLEAYAG
jgi:hypothetical protein